MKISELKRIAEENDYELTKSNSDYKLTHKYCENNITINGLCENRSWISKPFYCDEKDFNMIKAAVEFAETPLEDREDEKKFYLRHRWINAGGYHWYLSRLEDSRIYKYDLKEFDFGGNTDKEFTLTEIEEIKEKFDTDLADFELVEVEE